jgi:hypothetical protein
MGYKHSGTTPYEGRIMKNNNTINTINLDEWWILRTKFKGDEWCSQHPIHAKNKKDANKIAKYLMATFKVQDGRKLEWHTLFKIGKWLEIGRLLHVDFKKGLMG